MKTRYGKIDLDDRNDRNDGLVLGLLLGAAVGVCAAILFAPKSGKELRNTIKDVAGKQKSNLNKQWENVKDKASDAAKSAKDSLESTAGDAESKLNQYADKAQDGVNSVADKFQKRY